jgi:hypothetical protein
MAAGGLAGCRGCGECTDGGDVKKKREPKTIRGAMQYIARMPKSSLVRVERTNIFYLEGGVLKLKKGLHIFVVTP